MEDNGYADSDDSTCDNSVVISAWWLKTCLGPKQTQVSTQNLAFYVVCHSEPQLPPLLSEDNYNGVYFLELCEDLTALCVHSLASRTVSEMSMTVVAVVVRGSWREWHR